LNGDILGACLRAVAGFVAGGDVITVSLVTIDTDTPKFGLDGGAVIDEGNAFPVEHSRLLTAG